MERKFSILDAMIFLAATAIGMVLIRNYFNWYLPIPPKILTFHYLSSRIAAACPLLQAWSVCFLVIRLRRPRPPLWRVVRYASSSALIAASSILVVVLLFDSLPPLVHGEGPWESHFFWDDLFDGLPRQMGAAVAATWVVLALAGARCSEPTWIDRMGRSIGFSWVAYFLISSALRGWGL